MPFIIDNENDWIQQHWMQNRFYEERELKAIAKCIKPNSVILDVGANIGNHAIWLNQNVNPKQIYVIEPHPNAINLMLKNVAINYCHQIRFDFLGIALGEFKSKSVIKNYEPSNLGATSLEISDEGFIDTIPGDELGLDFDFIKIDVEGMELGVIRGLKETIKRCKPNMFIEIEDEHYEEFEKLMREYGYIIIFESRNYHHCRNCIVCPFQ